MVSYIVSGRNMTLPKYEASFRRIYRRYRNQSKKRSLDFTLTPEYFRQQCERPCTYCLAPPDNQMKCHERLNGVWKYNGLDRIDNNKGYIEGNVQPCCFMCNKLKSTLDEREFIQHISKIAFLSYWLKPIKEDEL